MNGIDNLLEKYFNGVSSTEEEKRLKNYFEGAGILPEHQIYRPIFVTFESEKQIKAPIITLPEKIMKGDASFRRTIFLQAGSAAVILLAITLSIFHLTQDRNAKYVVIVNGKKISDHYEAQHYAENMFGETEKMVESSFQPLLDATNMKEELNAEKILRETDQKIEQIKINYKQ